MGALTVSSKQVLTLIFALLFGSAAFSQTITLSPTISPPTTSTQVSGSGFAPNAAIDIYFDTTDLALATNVNRRPLQLLHFVRMLPAPDTEEIACYFFNRLEKNGVRWVSYHFEKDAERVTPDAAIVNLISEAEEGEDGAAAQPSPIQ
jgi:hypothetical protein